MRTASSLPLLILLCLAFTISSCATVIEGTTDRVRYDGGPGQLSFYDVDGNQIPSEHEYDATEDLHFNYIELNKKQPEHVITARIGKMMQRDTLRRKFGYGWLIPNALLLYPFPVFTGVDWLTGSIYSFPPPRLHLSPSDTSGLPSPRLLTLSSAADARYESEKVQLSVHTGLLTPIHNSPSYPPAYGIVGSYYLGNRLWSTLGYNYCGALEQRVGYANRVYDTDVHSVEGTLQYNPFKFMYLLAGVGFDHLVFQLASRPDDNEKRFGRNVMTGSFGAGAYFGGLFLELRRNLGLSRIETPEGPGHAVQFTHIRFGVAMRFESP